MQQLLIEAHAKLCAMFPGHLVSIQVSCANYTAANPAIYMYATISTDGGDHWTNVANDCRSISVMMVKAAGYARAQHRTTEAKHSPATAAVS